MTNSTDPNTVKLLFLEHAPRHEIMGTAYHSVLQWAHVATLGTITDIEPMALLPWLASRGVTVGRGNEGAIRMAGKVAHVRERMRADGKVEIVISHQRSNGTFYQRFTSRERALAAILGAK